MNAPAKLFTSVYLASSDPHHRNVLFGVSATVFLLGIFSIGFIEVMLMLARRIGKTREVRGEDSVGFMATMKRDSEKPGSQIGRRISMGDRRGCWATCCHCLNRLS